MRVRVYADEHVPRAVVRGLRLRGIDVETVSEAGTLGEADEVHLALANRLGRVVLTQDQDFLRLAAAGLPHAGIVYASQRLTTGQIVQGVLLIYEVLEAGEMVGQVEFL